MVTPSLLRIKVPEEEILRLNHLCPGVDSTSGASEERLLARFQSVTSYAELRSLLSEQIEVERRREERAAGRTFVRGLAVGMRLGFALALAGG